MLERPVMAIFVAKLVSLFFCLLAPNILFGAEEKQLLIKAGIISKVPNFVKWSPKKECIDDTRVHIQVLENDHVYKNLKLLASHSPTKKRKIELSMINHINQAESYSFVYLTKNHVDQLLKNIDFIKNNSVFIIGDGLDYPMNGLHLNIYTEKKKLRFEYSHSNLMSTDFLISHKLLKLARRNK